MADNPFYPGYTPGKSDDINPFYPGYFPGQPKQKPPKYQSDFKPTEFNFDQIIKSIDGIDYNVSLAGPNFPKWMVEQAVDAWKDTLKVSIRPPGVGAEEIDNYEGNLPGAFGIAVNLNPLDWVSDPGKTAKKMVEGWWKNATNWNDIEVRFRSEMIAKATSNVPAGSVALGFAAGAYGEAVGSQAIGEGLHYDITAGGGNPLRLTDRGVMIDDPIKPPTLDLSGGYTLTTSPTGQTEMVMTQAPVRGKTDIFAQVRNDLVELERNFTNPIRREPLLEKTNFDVLRGTVAEIEQNFTTRAPDPRDATGQRTKAMLTGAAFQRPEFQEAFDVSKAGVQLYDKMHSVSYHFNDNFIKPLQEGTFKDRWAEENARVSGQDMNAFMQDRGMARLDMVVGTRRTLINGADEVERIVGNVEPEWGQTFLNKHAKIAAKKYRDVANAGPAMEIAKQAMDLEAQLAGGTITQAQYDATKRQLADRIGQVSNRAIINSTGGKATAGIPMSGGDILILSPERSLAKDLTEVNIVKPGLHRHASLADIVAEGQQVAPDGLGSAAAAGYLRFYRNNQISKPVEEFMTAIEKGKLGETFIYPRVVNYIKASTPASLTDAYLKKHHYFGLNFNGDDQSFERSVVFNLAEGVDQVLRRNTGTALSGNMPNRTFGNYFTIRETVQSNPEAGLAERNITVAGKVYGGTHFKAVSKLNNILKNNNLTDDQLKLLLSVNTLDDFRRGIPGLTKLDIKANEQALNDLLGDIKAFRTWAKNNKNLIRTNALAGADGDYGGDYYRALIVALAKKGSHPDFAAIGITARYAGLLQKFYYNVNAVQSAFFDKVGKYIAPVVYAKQAVSDFISGALSKIFAGAIVGASGGTLAELYVAIERILRVIINLTIKKLTEYVGVVMRALKNADLDEILQYMDKSIEKYIKFALSIGLGMVFLIIVPGQKFMDTIVMSISPVDNTKITGLAELWESGPQLGSGAVVIPGQSKPASEGCFEFVDATGGMVDTSGVPYSLGSWGGNKAYQVFNGFAIPEMKKVVGGYMDRLCEKGTINLFWTDSKPNWCAHIYPGGSAFASDSIVFSATCAYNGTDYYAYLFTHETGHIYLRRLGGLDSAPGKITYQEAVSRDGGTLPTYPITYSGGQRCSTSNSVGEDFAETIGNYVRVNTWDCPGTDGIYQGTFMGHFEYADEVLTRPYEGPTTPTP